RAPSPANEFNFPPEGIDLERVLGDVEREYLLRALGRAGGVRKEAARLLGVTFRSVRYRLAKHGIDPAAGESPNAGAATAGGAGASAAGDADETPSKAKG